MATLLRSTRRWTSSSIWAELDLMARLAGMTLWERWGDWNREPFTSASTKHISVWEDPAQHVALATAEPGRSMAD